MCDVCKKLTDSTEHYVFSSIPIHIGGKKYETQIGSCEMSIEYWNQEDWDYEYIYDLLITKMKELREEMSKDYWHDQKEVQRIREL